MTLEPAIAKRFLMAGLLHPALSRDHAQCFLLRDAPGQWPTPPHPPSAPRSCQRPNCSKWIRLARWETGVAEGEGAGSWVTTRRKAPQRPLPAPPFAT